MVDMAGDTCSFETILGLNVEQSELVTKSGETVKTEEPKKEMISVTTEEMIVRILINYRFVLIGIVVFLVFVKILCRLRRIIHERDVDPVPYTCLYIDATFEDFKCVMSSCRENYRRSSEGTSKRRETLFNEIQEAWTKASSQLVITCLSIKTGLDLFLRVQKYPPNSEIIMTAINTPDVARIIVHHGLKVVPIDINRHTLSAHPGTLGRLINEQTVAIWFTHLYGNMADLNDAIDLAHSHGIHVLEDCSQCYGGPDSEGNPESDLVFYDFDVIRACTAFGGAVIKVKDNILFNNMRRLHDSYPVQREWEYFKLALKTFTVGTMLRRKLAIRFTTYIGGLFGIDIMADVKTFLTTERSKVLIRKLREQPPTSLLQLLANRFTNFDPQDLSESKTVCEYVCERLPPTAGQIGTKTKRRGFWLFPILVDDPDEVIKHLNKLGVNATKSVVNLQVIAHNQAEIPYDEHVAQEPLLFGLNYTEYPPDESRDILDHVIYLPVHKHVTQYYLDEICLAVEIVLNKLAILKKYKSSLTIHGPYGPILHRPAKNGAKRKTVSFSPTVKVRSTVPKNQQQAESHRSPSQAYYVGRGDS